MRAGRSALEALGQHPYDAERHARGYVAYDKMAIRELAELYDPEIPAHENKPYVARSREFMERQEEAMRGMSGSFGQRLDRGWVPPTAEDIEKITAENAADSAAPER